MSAHSADRECGPCFEQLGSHLTRIDAVAQGTPRGMDQFCIDFAILQSLVLTFLIIKEWTDFKCRDEQDVDIRKIIF
jgi:hypothetical protein